MPWNRLAVLHSNPWSDLLTPSREPLDPDKRYARNAQRERGRSADARFLYRRFTRAIYAESRTKRSTTE
jgi:hypothetical protein